jgi:hypothetical protein
MAVLGEGIEVDVSVFLLFAGEATILSSSYII